MIMLRHFADSDCESVAPILRVSPGVARNIVSERDDRVFPNRRGSEVIYLKTI